MRFIAAFLSLFLKNYKLSRICIVCGGTLRSRQRKYCSNTHRDAYRANAARHRNRQAHGRTVPVNVLIRFVLYLISIFVIVVEGLYRLEVAHAATRFVAALLG